MSVDTNEIFKANYPESVWLTPGDYFVGKYVGLFQGPDSGYGRQAIMVFEAEDSSEVEAKTGRKTLDAGTEYSYWVTLSTPRESLKRLRPGAGERIAVRHGGMRESNRRTGPDGKPVRYADVQLVCPDRDHSGDTLDFDLL